jgi:protein-L-isoaspartate(D-aspartate) O-methyltransferase
LSERVGVEKTYEIHGFSADIGGLGGHSVGAGTSGQTSFTNGSRRRVVNHNLYAGTKLRTLPRLNPRRTKPLAFVKLHTSMNIEFARQQMIDQQVRTWEVLDNAVLDVLRLVHRDQFVPDAFRNVAFADVDVPLGHGQCMLAPKVDGKILQALAVTKTDQVLDVGTGSGFLAACLGRLGASVRSIEIFPDLAERAAGALQSAAANNVSVEAADALKLNDELRYDAIAVTGSMPTLGALESNSFARALKTGGRLVMFVGQAPVMQAIKITRVGQNEWQSEDLFETVVAPLINVTQPTKFAF